jgi:hypothetical protein
MSPKLRFSDRVILAALPVLAATGSVRDSIFLATLIAVHFFILASFYRAGWRFFPRSVLGFSAVVYLIFAGAVSWYFIDITPVWIASVFLLGVTDFKRRKPKAKKVPAPRSSAEIISNPATAIWGRGFAFWYLLVALAGVRFGLTRYFPLRALALPGGAFLLLAAAAFAVQWFETGRGAKKTAAKPA